MKESVTYQAILEEGMVKGLQKLLLRLGTKEIGIPDALTINTIKSIDDLARLEEILDRFLKASSWSWSELLKEKEVIPLKRWEFDDGKVEALRNVIFRLGRKRLGPPDNATKATLEEISDVPRLENLCERLLDVTSWQELLK